MERYPTRVGLTMYRERAAWGVWDEPADLLPASYADAISLAGATPLLLPPGQSEPLNAAASSALWGLHGLVLTGGADVDPVRYGAVRDPATGPPRADRDSWEIELAHVALQRDMPLLAVCRGMQVLAVALGGSLTQHLPDVVGNDSHCPTPGHHGRHEVILAKGSRLARILGSVTNVATYHHQAVDRLPAAVVATGWTEDETIEAFELPDQTWAVAVQWHPEVVGGRELFRAFVKATQQWRAAHPSTPEPIDYVYSGETLL